MTEKESAHPTSQQLNELTNGASANGDLVDPVSPTSIVPPQPLPDHPLPPGTGVQPPTQSNEMPSIQNLTISDKVSGVNLASLIYIQYHYVSL